MHTEPHQIEDLFTAKGGRFHISSPAFLNKLQGIRAFIFDWDGVFNAAEKDAGGSSPFNEVDSMGLNLLRFAHWLKKGKLPLIAIISGEKNSASFALGKREHLDACYYKINHKPDALNHFCQEHKLNPLEVAFVFDDILDISLAQVCGLRFHIQRPGASLFHSYVVHHQLADYSTGSCSGQYPVRECCELIMGLSGTFDLAVEERVRFSPAYTEYLKLRNEKETDFFTRSESGIIRLAPEP
ncbi:MAG TPA: phosphatase [Bacteroidia bacterium]|jgi:3-deoxy-D-manno-octulosonate 8-phosphate phosphatase (KDO 8-P phosphatase)|nr:phosphatase [Bacteroidia bacterium]